MSSPAVQPLLALLACPVGGNPTQYVIEQTFAHHELDWRYLTFEVGPEKLGRRRAGIAGVGLSRRSIRDAPHKQAIIPLLDRTTETAAAIGAVNFVFREENALVGENTEGKGVVQAIRGIARSGRKASGSARRGRSWPGPWPSNWPPPARPDWRSSIAPRPGPANWPRCCSGQVQRRRFRPPLWQGDYAVPPETEILIDATSLGHECKRRRVAAGGRQSAAGVVRGRRNRRRASRRGFCARPAPAAAKPSTA